MDQTLTQILRALYEAHKEIEALRARVRDLEVQLGERDQIRGEIKAV